jgi:hypothetical protein
LYHKEKAKGPFRNCKTARRFHVFIAIKKRARQRACAHSLFLLFGYNPVFQGNPEPEADCREQDKKWGIEYEKILHL